MIRGLLLFLVLVDSAQTCGPEESTVDSNDPSKTPAPFTFSLNFSDPLVSTAGTDATVAPPKFKRSESVRMKKTIKTPRKLRHKLIRRHSDNSTEEAVDVAPTQEESKLTSSISEPIRLNGSNEVKHNTFHSTRKTSANSSPQSPSSGSPKKSPRFISISPLNSNPPSPDEKRKLSRSSPTFSNRLDMVIRRKSISEKQFAEEKRRSRKNSSDSSETSLEQAVEEAAGERKRRVSDSSAVSSSGSHEAKNKLEKKVRRRSHSFSSSSDTISLTYSSPKRRSSSKRLTKRFSFRKSSTSGSLEDQSASPDSGKDSPIDSPEIDQFFEKWSDSKCFIDHNIIIKMSRQASQSTLHILIYMFPVDALVEALEAHELLVDEDESEDGFLKRVSSYKDNPPWRPDSTVPILIKWAFISYVQSTLIETYWNVLIGSGDMARALYLLVAEDERRLLMGEPPLDPIDSESPVHFRGYAQQVTGLDCPLARIFYLMYGNYLPKKMRKAIDEANGDIKKALFGCVKKTRHN